MAARSIFYSCTLSVIFQLQVLGTVSYSVDTVANVVDFVVGATGIVINDVLHLDPSLKTNFFDPDLTKNMSDLIRGLGYPVEEYKVTTSDGYILGMYRIPHGLNNSADADKPALLMLHGISSASWDYVMNYFAYQNLATILADAGYDVFLGNYRGNIFSQEHVTLKTNDPKFWEFSWDEMALMDLPAMIDFVLDTTGQEKLYYVGHSMGTTTLFALLSTTTTKNYNNKIKMAACMSPVAKLKYATAPIVKLYQFRDIITVMTELTGTKGYVPPNNAVAKLMTNLICGNGVTATFCRTLDEIELGKDSGHMNRTRLPVYQYHRNAGSSSYCLVQFAQAISADRFQRYDFGPEKNLNKYGTKTPPEYDVSQITAPLAFYSSLGDALSMERDIDFLRQNLKPGVLVEDFIVEAQDYAHIDFLYAVDAYKYVYQFIVQHFKGNR